MHSMLKRKRVHQKNNNAASLHVPVTQFQFKLNQKRSNSPQQKFQIKVKKMKISSNTQIKTLRNSSLPHLNRSQSNQRLNFSSMSKCFNTLRTKSKDQIEHNKIKGEFKINQSFTKNIQESKISEDQKENILKSKFYLGNKKEQVIDRYERKIKCNKTCNYFHRKDALQSGAIEDLCLSLGGNRQRKEILRHCKSRTIFKEKKQISESLEVEGQKPKWQLFEFGIGTQRKFTIRRTGRKTEK